MSRAEPALYQANHNQLNQLIFDWRLDLPSQSVDPPFRRGMPAAAVVASVRDIRSSLPIRDLDDAARPGRSEKSTSMKRRIMSFVT